MLWILVHGRRAPALAITSLNVFLISEAFTGIFLESYIFSNQGLGLFEAWELPEPKIQESIVEGNSRVSSLGQYVCEDIILTLSLLGYLKTRICWGGVNLTTPPLNPMFFGTPCSLYFARYFAEFYPDLTPLHFYIHSLFFCYLTSIVTSQFYENFLIANTLFH